MKVVYAILLAATGITNLGITGLMIKKIVNANGLAVAFNDQNFVYVIVIGITFLLTLLFLLLFKRATNKTGQKAVKELKDSEETLRKSNEKLFLKNNDLEEENKLLQRTVGLINVINNAKDMTELTNSVIDRLSKEMELCQVAFFLAEEEEEKNMLVLRDSYAYHVPESQEVKFEFGEGLSGQVAKQGSSIVLDEVPEGYIQVLSGLGKSTPSSLTIIPVKFNERVLGIMEISSFSAFSEHDKQLFEKLSVALGASLYFFKEKEKLDALSQQEEIHEIRKGA